MTTVRSGGVVLKWLDAVVPCKMGSRYGKRPLTAAVFENGLPEAAGGGLFVGVHVKNGIEPGDLK
jgi:hypothetical protein